MTTFVMYAAAIISVAIVIFMLIKKMDIKITLFLMGIVLMFVGCALGNPLGGEDFVSTGSVFLDPLKVIADQFKSTISSSGFIILILGGYSAYMSAINANSVTVNVLTKPIEKSNQYIYWYRSYFYSETCFRLLYQVHQTLQLSCSQHYIQSL